MYEDMTKDELQEELESRDLPTSGNKPDLIARLELNDAEAEEAAEPSTPTEAASTEDIIAAQEKPDSGQRPSVADAPAGQPEEGEEVDSEEGFQSAAKRKRIEEDWEDPEPVEVGRKRDPVMDQFDYELLPDGRKRKLIFLPDEDDE